MSRRVIASFTLLVLPLCAILAVTWRVHPRPRPAATALAKRLPAPDLALASGARQLRMPSLEEPWAPFEDSPGLLDADPAGGFFRPEPRR